MARLPASPVYGYLEKETETGRSRQRHPPYDPAPWILWFPPAMIRMLWDITCSRGLQQPSGRLRFPVDVPRHIRPADQLAGAGDLRVRIVREVDLHRMDGHNNPYSYKPGGFLPGAGHGSTMQDRDGCWWHTATMRISVNHVFERRVGLWPAGVDLLFRPGILAIILTEPLIAVFHRVAPDQRDFI